MPRKKPANNFHHPHALGSDWKSKTNKACRYIKDDGMKVNEAVTLVFGVNEKVWFRWRKEALEDIENGFTGTTLQKVVTQLCQADVEAGRLLSRRARDLALADESNVEMLKFLLERRHGYKKESKKDVEVSTKDDFNFNINITDSKKE